MLHTIDMRCLYVYVRIFEPGDCSKSADVYDRGFFNLDQVGLAQAMAEPMYF